MSYGPLVGTLHSLHRTASDAVRNLYAQINCAVDLLRGSESLVAKKVKITTPRSKVRAE